MRKVTFRGRGSSADPDAYWRRRFFILGGGLAVLMLVAWLSGGGGPSRQATQTAAARASAAAKEAQGSLPSAALGTPYGAGPSVSGSPSPSFSPPGGTATATPSPSPSTAGSAASTAAGSGAGGRCPAGSVVLSLFTSQPDYRPSEQPTFDVYAVSTSASACRLKYGPAAVRLVVTRHGKVMWDSAACRSTHRGAKTVSMVPGVPQEVVFSWDRKASARSCAGAAPRGGTGTFQAVAQADGHTSPVRSFKLLRS